MVKNTHFFVKNKVLRLYFDDFLLFIGYKDKILEILRIS